MTKGATYVASTNIYGQFINCQKTKQFHGSSNEGLTHRFIQPSLLNFTV